MWGELVLDSLRRPRAAARRLLDLGLGADLLLQAAVLQACAGTVLLFAASRLVPPPAGADLAALVEHPLLAALLHLAELAVIAVLVTRIGRFFGGTGSMAGAMALVVWIYAMMLLALAAMLLAMVTVPPLALLLGAGFLLWLIFAPASFVAELHGFQNALIVFAGMLLTVISVLLLLNFLYAILGLTPQETT